MFFAVRVGEPYSLVASANISAPSFFQSTTKSWFPNHFRNEPPFWHGNHRRPEASAAGRSGTPNPILDSDGSHHCRRNLLLSLVCSPARGAAISPKRGKFAIVRTAPSDTQYARGLPGITFSDAG